MDQLYYLCFSVNKLPDLTLTKYSVFDGSSVENIMDKHGVFYVNCIGLDILLVCISIYCIITIQIKVFRKVIICLLFSMQLHRTGKNWMGFVNF